MTNNYAQWNAALKKVTFKFPEEHFAPLVLKISFYALRQIVFLSPVGNPTLWKSVKNGASPPAGYVGGQFRNSWFIDVAKNAIYTGTYRKPDASGSSSLSEGNKLNQLKSDPFKYITIHNALPYAVKLEQGHSLQARGPYAIVGRVGQAISAGLGFKF